MGPIIMKVLFHNENGDTLNLKALSSMCCQNTNMKTVVNSRRTLQKKKTNKQTRKDSQFLSHDKSRKLKINRATKNLINKIDKTDETR